MSQKAKLIVVFAIILAAAGAYYFLQAGPDETHGDHDHEHAELNPQDSAPVAGESASTETFALQITQGALAGNETITVRQGSTVTLVIISDEAEELHVHGYDKSVELVPGEESTLTFAANASGRFPFELEGSKTELGVLEVLP